MYFISEESFKSVIRNKWQPAACSLPVAEKCFKLQQKFQVEGRLLNTGTALF